MLICGGAVKLLHDYIRKEKGKCTAVAWFRHEIQYRNQQMVYICYLRVGWGGWGGINLQSFKEIRLCHLTVLSTDMLNNHRMSLFYINYGLTTSTFL